MILLIRDNECYEPRVINYINYFEKNNIPYRIIGWDRSGGAEKSEHRIYFHRRSEYGRELANIPNKLLWMLFVAKQIYTYRKECKFVHACDSDVAFPAIIMGKLLRKKVVFDVFDWISLKKTEGFAFKILDWISRFCYRHAYCAIICDEGRKKQTDEKCRELLVLPNIPNADNNACCMNMAQELRSEKKYRYILSYVGVFDYNRGLEDLLVCVSRIPDVCLNIAGFGTLEGLVKEYAQKYENISYLGRLNHDQALCVMKNSDYIVAMYYLTNASHAFAAPNKYYESLMLETPLITTLNTLVGNKVEKYKTGFAIKEGQEALEDLLRSHKLDVEKEKMRQNCKIIWDTMYVDYFENFMREEYARLL